MALEGPRGEGRTAIDENRLRETLLEKYTVERVQGGTVIGRSM